MSVPAALHGWHARPGTSSSLPTTAEQALSQCWQRIDQLPCVPESRTALFVVPSGSSPFCTSLTATRERRQRAKTLRAALLANSLLQSPHCCHAMLLSYTMQSCTLVLMLLLRVLLLHCFLLYLEPNTATVL